MAKANKVKIIHLSKFLVSDNQKPKFFNKQEVSG